MMTVVCSGLLLLMMMMVMMIMKTVLCSRLLLLPPRPEVSLTWPSLPSSCLDMEKLVRGTAAREARVRKYPQKHG